MENCLVTKLKGSVLNDNIPKIGELILNGIDVASPYITVPSGKTVTVSGKNGTKLKASGSSEEVTILTGRPVSGFSVVPSTGASISIYNKYEVTYLNGIFNISNDIIDDLKYMPLTSIGISFSQKASMGKFLTNIQHVTSLTFINNKNQYYDAELSDLIKLRSLPLVDVNFRPSVDYTETNGGEFDIEDIGKSLPNTCTTIRLANSSVVGAIESFVAGLRTNQTTGSVSLYISNPSNPGQRLITFQGTKITGGGSTQHTLSWTASTITFDGTEISA